MGHKNAAICRILASQALVSMVKSQAESSDEFAYDIITGSTVTYRCIGASAYFIPSTTYDDNSRTFAFCDRLGDLYHVVPTSCDGPTILYTGWHATAADEDPSGSYVCSSGLICFTATIYESYNGGQGLYPRDYIACDHDKAWPTYFMENPDNWTTTVPDTTVTITIPGKTATITREATEKKSVTDGVPDPTSSNTVDLVTPSSPAWSFITQTSTTKPSVTGDGSGDGGGDGPGVGTIAGAVVGAVAGVAAIAGALIIGFRMGRRHPPLDNQEAGTKKSFRDTLSSLPRPTITWIHRDTKKSANSDRQNAVSVLQVNSPDDAVESVELPSPVSHTPRNQARNALQTIGAQTHAAPEFERPGAELATGLEAQGWARSESHPLPYEVDSTQR